MSSFRSPAHPPVHSPTRLPAHPSATHSPAHPPASVLDPQTRTYCTIEILGTKHFTIQIVRTLTDSFASCTPAGPPARPRPARSLAHWLVRVLPARWPTGSSLFLPARWPTCSSASCPPAGPPTRPRPARPLAHRFYRQHIHAPLKLHSSNVNIR